jgi:translation initiation factor 1
MTQSSDNSRLVYSTGAGRMCPECGKPAARCVCRKRKTKARAAPVAGPDDGTVRIRREVKGRKGKTVTVVLGVPLQGKDLQAFARGLKQSCGAGGSVKDGVIVIQGDHRDALATEIKKRGYAVKLAGG